MRHLTEEELWEHGCSPDAVSSELRTHVRSCADCRSKCDELQAIVEVFKTGDVPERSASDSARLWLELKEQLPVYGKEKVRWWSLPSSKLLVSIAACAVLIFSGFVGGRLWERAQQGSSVHVAELASRERMVRSVSGDHLERCERILIQLNHDGEKDAALEQEAHDLLADNRLLQQSASEKGDRLLALVLDHLGRVLAEVAHDPAATGRTGLEHLRKDMNTEGLLFQIRVLRGTAQNRI